MNNEPCSCKHSAGESEKCKLHQNRDEVRWAQDTSPNQDFDEVSQEQLDKD
jgi:hypothetical protein